MNHYWLHGVVLAHEWAKERWSDDMEPAKRGRREENGSFGPFEEREKKKMGWARKPIRRI